MSITLITVISVLLILLIVGAPVIFAIGSAGLTYFVMKPGMLDSLTVYVHKFYTGMDSFVFLAIPLFILAGEFLSQGNMMDQLVNFARMLVGRFRGGVAYVNVLASMMFGGISGSALADISALGPMEIKMMKKAGYSKDFSAALTATSAIQGPIIPPSIPLVIFASLTNVSVGALFIAGAVPGILLGLGQMLVIFYLARRKNFPVDDQKISFKQAVNITSAAIYALLLPVIIIGGILGGIFTATEAAAVSVGYALLINLFVYKSVTFAKIKQALINTARVTASIYLIIAFTSVIGWILAMERVPSMIQDLVVVWDLSPYMLLFIVNIFFLLNGMWISDVAQLLLFAPIFTPIFAEMGIHPVHFGVVMVVNVMISMITPPYGTALYLAASISGSKLTAIVRESLPFLAVSIGVLFLISYAPQLVLFLPKLFGAIQ